ncbi:hypothetical protein BOW53_03960 [Solemya pervernicosa gill symbiont]|uniref:Uncharacterized protein n=1 Tax=Solemya pervernicosa gill symbiont TaxID=642797 RepID=A0A1T2L8J9_9GAMM|nr:hypothetical protein [Solemya pervernicosa gill symbiont]OOZ41411.1 hypothetical protein BOW53_03960 [Solemya pervernicosa gill symbiont]
MVLQFRSRQVGIDSGANSVSLTGYAIDGDEVVEQDAIETLIAWPRGNRSNKNVDSYNRRRR